MKVVEALKSQLDAEGVPEYIEMARRFGHGVSIMLQLFPDGNLGKPKVSIDTREGERQRSYRARGA